MEHGNQARLQKPLDFTQITHNNLLTTQRSLYTQAPPKPPQNAKLLTSLLPVTQWPQSDTPTAGTSSSQPTRAMRSEKEEQERYQERTHLVPKFARPCGSAWSRTAYRKAISHESSQAVAGGRQGWHLVLRKATLTG